MDKQELLDLMDIEKGEDLKYFESIADLFEADEGYTSEDLYDALKGADVQSMSVEDLIRHALRAMVMQ